METENIKKMYALLDEIPVTDENEETLVEIKECLLNGDFITALNKIKKIQLENEENKDEENSEEQEGSYPEELSDIELEHIYMGLLLNNPKLIVKYYFFLFF